MLTLIIIVLACTIAAAIVMIWRGVSGRGTWKWDKFELEAPVGAILVLAAIGGMAYSYAQYSQGFEKENERLSGRMTSLEGDVQTAKDAAKTAQDDASKAKSDRDTLRTALDNKTAEAKELGITVAREQTERRQAQEMMRAAWMTMNYTRLSEKQRTEYDQLNKDVDALNDRLTLLKITAVDRPNIEGRAPFAIFEIYRKEWGADETAPRGAGLFDFQVEQFKVTGDYQGRLAEVMRSEISKAICDAALGALVKGISLSDAISRIPRIQTYDVDPNFVAGLAEFKYVQMQFQLMAGMAQVLILGYADGERGPWRRPLGTTPRKIEVHENVRPNAPLALTFRENLTSISIGREEKGATTYGNDDLPNLRAAEAAEIVTTLTDGCRPPPPSPASAGTTTVQILSGRVYQEHREVDRRARVYLLAFLKD